MIKLVWLAEAQDDLRRLHEFIKPHSPDAAYRAVNKLITAAEVLIEFPQKGRLWPADSHFRELPVSFGAREYVIRYREFEDLVVIVRIWHALEHRL